MCDLCALGLPLVPVESPCAPAARGCPQPVLSCCRVRFCGTLCSSSRCVTRSLSPHLWISLLCRACPVHLCKHLFSSACGAVETQHFGFHRLCRVWSELFEVRGVQDHPWCPPGLCAGGCSRGVLLCSQSCPSPAPASGAAWGVVLGLSGSPRSGDPLKLLCGVSVGESCCSSAAPQQSSAPPGMWALPCAAQCPELFLWDWAQPPVSGAHFSRMGSLFIIS